MKMNEESNSILNYVEYIFVIIVAAAIAFWLTFLDSGFLLSYTSNALSTQLLQFGGVLFGLLLTAYAIVLTLVPSLGSVLETLAFKKTNLNFTLALPMTLIMIVISFSIIFTTGSLQQVLIFLQLLLLFAVLQLAFVLTVAIGLLFRSVVKKTAKR